MNGIMAIADRSDKSRICREILERLPEWIGNQLEVDSYANETKDLPFYAAIEGGNVVGFMALLPHNAHTAEIYLMGVLADHHRKGIGKKLVNEALMYCRTSGKAFLTVKTLDVSDPYGRTRAFYRKMGFLPFQLLMNYWGENSPCLMMARSIFPAIRRAQAHASL